MKSKTKKRTWFDVQIAILTVAMTAVLGLWNIFAGPDRDADLNSQVDELAGKPASSMDTSPTPVVSSAMPVPGEKIMLGGKEPQTTIVVQQSRGSSRTTSTRSS
jgi:hypothetical protein